MIQDYFLSAIGAPRGGTGGVSGVKFVEDVRCLPTDVRKLMIENGAQNVDGGPSPSWCITGGSGATTQPTPIELYSEQSVHSGTLFIFAVMTIGALAIIHGARIMWKRSRASITRK